MGRSVLQSGLFWALVCAGCGAAHTGGALLARRSLQRQRPCGKLQVTGFPDKSYPDSGNFTPAVWNGLWNRTNDVSGVAHWEMAAGGGRVYHMWWQVLHDSEGMGNPEILFITPDKPERPADNAQEFHAFTSEAVDNRCTDGSSPVCFQPFNWTVQKDVHHHEEITSVHLACLGHNETADVPQQSLPVASELPPVSSQQPEPDYEKWGEPIPPPAEPRDPPTPPPPPAVSSPPPSESCDGLELSGLPARGYDGLSPAIWNGVWARVADVNGYPHWSRLIRGTIYHIWWGVTRVGSPRTDQQHPQPMPTTLYITAEQYGLPTLTNGIPYGAGSPTKDRKQFCYDGFDSDFCLKLDRFEIRRTTTVVGSLKTDNGTALPTMRCTDAPREGVPGLAPALSSSSGGQVGQCEEGPCLNDGTCIEAVNFAHCDCPANFAGDLCERALEVPTSRLWRLVNTHPTSQHFGIIEIKFFADRHCREPIPHDLGMPLDNTVDITSNGEPRRREPSDNAKKAFDGRDPLVGNGMEAWVSPCRRRSCRAWEGWIGVHYDTNHTVQCVQFWPSKEPPSPPMSLQHWDTDKNTWNSIAGFQSYSGGKGNARVTLLNEGVLSGPGREVLTKSLSGGVPAIERQWAMEETDEKLPASNDMPGWMFGLIVAVCLLFIGCLVSCFICGRMYWACLQRSCGYCFIGRQDPNVVKFRNFVEDDDHRRTGAPR
mmetsp:Transcript_43560/g.123421  ORF Transcript_43560/g.123421 Transcript_43560/m.123421 type:complete len:712 (+) Transcript_43560:115-2250(+)